LVLTKRAQRDDHNTVRLPEDLTDEMDRLIGKHGFRSRAEIAKEAIRDLLKKYPLPPPQPQGLGRINGDATGVRLYDPKIEGNKAVHVSVRDNKGVICDYHETNNCEHVKFALTLSDVQEMIRKRRKEGWRIELPEE